MKAKKTIFFLEKNQQTAYIKPNNYEQSKKKKYKNDIGCMENMIYDAEKDLYQCHRDQKLVWKYDKKEKTVKLQWKTV